MQKLLELIGRLPEPIQSRRRQQVEKECARRRQWVEGEILKWRRFYKLRTEIRQQGISLWEASYLGESHRRSILTVNAGHFAPSDNLLSEMEKILVKLKNRG